MAAHDLPDGNDARFSSLTDEVTLMQASFTDHAFERHSHDCFSIGLTTFGVQRFRCKGRQHDSRAGDFVLFNPDEDHDGRRGTSDGFRYTIWYLSDAFVRSCAGAGEVRPAGQAYFAAPHLTDRTMARAFRTLTHDLPMNARETLRTESLLRGFLCAMLQRHGERPGADMPQPAEAGLARMTRVKDYIRTYFQRDLTLAELAGVAGLSRSHLARVFGATFNAAPHVYLNAVRIGHAQRLIALGMPLAAVAAECGFADQSHFARRFKGSVGVAPADWRRMRAAMR